MGNVFFCCLGVGGRGERRSDVPPPPLTETETSTPLQSVSVTAASYQNLCLDSKPYPHQNPRYCSSPPPPSVVYAEAVTIRNDTSLRKATLRLEPDPVNPGRLLVAFTFDSLVSGRITVLFFAKEDEITATKEDTITFQFEKGLGQKFIQPSGTGVDLSELFKEAEPYTFPLAIKMEAADSGFKQITLVTYVKEKGEIKTSVIKLIMWVNGTRYELEEIYGIGDTVDEDARRECVVCLEEPRDTTVLPCRHMCMCGGCAKELRFQINLCPVCRQPVERLLKIHLKEAMEEIERELKKM